MSLAQVLGDACTLLFVPGDRPERFSKASESGADLVVLDLEDAVAPSNKDGARRHVEKALDDGGAYGVRINAPGTEWFVDDLELMKRYPCVVMLPKAEDVDQVAAIADTLSGASVLLLLIETARGVLSAPNLAGVPGVRRLALGHLDLASQLGISPDDDDALAAARGALVLAASAAGLPAPLDGVTPAVNDGDALVADAARARRLGFGGKLCIHPRQVPLVRDLFAPTDDEVAWAERIIEAVAQAPSSSVFTLDGEMVDAPVIRRAQMILARGATTVSLAPESGRR